MLSRSYLAALFLGIFTEVAPIGAEESPDDAPATAITIYSNLAHSSREARGRALVQQRLRIELPRGEGSVELGGVPALLDPASVLLRPIDGGQLEITEQSFQSIASDPDSVLRGYVGEDVLINRRQSGPGEQSRVTETINAKLLAFDDKVLVLQTNNRQLPIQIITRGSDVTEIKLMRGASMPATRPTLSWQASSDEGGPRNLELIYETRGLAWDADYTLLLDGDGSAASLDAWANIVNRSGSGFSDAVVRLVVDQNTAQSYLLPRRVSLAADGARRVALLDGGGDRHVKASRANVFAAHLGADVAECVTVANARENRLGVPLPPGRVRVLRRGEGDDDGGSAPAALIGESKVPATAVGRAMIARLGRANGLVAKREIGESGETIKGVRTTKVTIGNRRKENAQVLVIEQLNAGARRVLQHSHPYDADPAGETITFLLEIPPGEAETVSYSVGVKGD